MNDLDIKKIRIELGMTQADFAKRLGISIRTVQNWESGGAIPEMKDYAPKKTKKKASKK